MEWDTNSELCKVMLPGHQKWKNIEFSYCKKLQTSLAKNLTEFTSQLKKHRSVQATHLTQGPHIPLAELEINGIKVAVRKNKATWCNEKQVKCTEDVFDRVDELGEQMRIFIAQELNSKH